MLPRTQVVDPTVPEILVLVPQTLRRECLCLALEARQQRVLPASSLAECGAAREGSVALLSGSGHAETLRQLDHIARSPKRVRTLVLGDTEEPDDVVAMLEGGAHGYVSASTNLNILVGAIALVRAGGTYIPSSSLMAARRVTAHPPEFDDHLRSILSPVQLATINGVRLGKPNKIIAYELGIQVGAVKNHIRIAMRRLSVTNRTQLAFAVNRLKDEAQA